MRYNESMDANHGPFNRSSFAHAVVTGEPRQGWKALTDKVVAVKHHHDHILHKDKDLASVEYFWDFKGNLSSKTGKHRENFSWYEMLECYDELKVVRYGRAKNLIIPLASSIFMVSIVLGYMLGGIYATLAMVVSIGFTSLVGLVIIYFMTFGKDKLSRYLS